MSVQIRAPWLETSTRSYFSIKIEYVPHVHGNRLLDATASWSACLASWFIPGSCQAVTLITCAVPYYVWYIARPCKTHIYRASNFTVAISCTLPLPYTRLGAYHQTVYIGRIPHRRRASLDVHSLLKTFTSVTDTAACEFAFSVTLRCFRTSNEHLLWPLDSHLSLAQLPQDSARIFPVELSAQRHWTRPRYAHESIIYGGYLFLLGR